MPERPGRGGGHERQGLRATTATAGRTPRTSRSAASTRTAPQGGGRARGGGLPRELLRRRRRRPRDRPRGQRDRRRRLGGRPPRARRRARDRSGQSRRLRHPDAVGRGSTCSTRSHGYLLLAERLLDDPAEAPRAAQLRARPARRAGRRARRAAERRLRRPSWLAAGRGGAARARDEGARASTRAAPAASSAGAACSTSASARLDGRLVPRLLDGERRARSDAAPDRRATRSGCERRARLPVLRRAAPAHVRRPRRAAARRTRFSLASSSRPATTRAIRCTPRLRPLPARPGRRRSCRRSDLLGLRLLLLVLRRLARSRARFADDGHERLGLGPSLPVVEVASNDGYLLQELRRRGHPGARGRAGGECRRGRASRPACRQRCAFFGARAAEGARGARHRRRPVVANNVLAHVPDLNDFVAGLAHVLEPDGRGHDRGAAPAAPDRATRSSTRSTTSTTPTSRCWRPATCSPPRACACSTSRSCRPTAAGCGSGPRATERRRRGRAGGRARAATPSGRRARRVRELRRVRPAGRALLAELRVPAAAPGGGARSPPTAPRPRATRCSTGGRRARRHRVVVDRSPHKQGMLLPGSHLRPRCRTQLPRTGRRPAAARRGTCATRSRPDAASASWACRFVTAVPAAEVLRDLPRARRLAGRGRGRARAGRATSAAGSPAPSSAELRARGVDFDGPPDEHLVERARAARCAACTCRRRRTRRRSSSAASPAPSTTSSSTCAPARRPRRGGPRRARRRAANAFFVPPGFAHGFLTLSTTRARIPDLDAVRPGAAPASAGMTLPRDRLALRAGRDLGARRRLPGHRLCPR